MSNNYRTPSPWSQLSLFIGLAGAMFIFFVLLSSVVYLIAGLGDRIKPGMAFNDIAVIDISKIVQFLFSVIVFGLTGYLYARFAYRDRPVYALGFRPAARNGFYLMAILLLVFSLPLEEWLGELNRHIPLWHWMVRAEQDNDRQVEAFVKVHHAFDPVINVMVMAAVPAFCEELCFRGALQPILIRICKRPMAGILVAAFLFSFFHLQFEGFVPRMFLGFLLGAAYWYSGSLWVAIVAHFFFNAVQIVAAMYIPVIASGDRSAASKNPSFSLLFVFLSLVIVVGLLSWMRKNSTHGVEPLDI